MNCICCGTNFDAHVGSCPRCSWNPDAVHDFTAGYDIGDIVKGRYKVKQHLGVGRLGVSIRALDLKKNRPVVLKIIHPGLLPDDDSRSAFVARLKPFVGPENPFIASIFDVVKDRQNCFVVREFLNGATLERLMTDQQMYGQAFPRDEAIRVIQRISKALASVSGHVHGLFSPTKVWVLSDGIKLVDCGVAGALPPAALWHAATRTEMRRYVAPELVDNRPPEPSSDVYALGVLLGEMLTLATFNGDVAVFRDTEPTFSREAEALVRCALSVNPDARYRDAVEFISALCDITGDARPSMAPPGNTAVVPFKFLNELRSMSVVPPALADVSVSDSEFPDLEDDDDEIDDELDAFPEEVTRQVVAASITEDHPGAFREIPDRSSAFDDDVSANDVDLIDDEDLIDDDDDDFFSLSLDSNPADDISEDPSFPPTPSVAPPMPTPRAVQPSSAPPLPWSTTTLSRRKSMPLPRPTLPRPPDSVVAPPRPMPSSPPTTASLRPSIRHPVSAESGPAEEIPDRLEGINPRFLRAAAKLEKARISQVEPGSEASDAEEEEWRKRLEESSTGSVISFLPPSNLTEEPQPVKGFPNNRQPQKPRIPPVPKPLSKPPPLPPRKK